MKLPLVHQQPGSNTGSCGIISVVSGAALAFVTLISLAPDIRADEINYCERSAKAMKRACENELQDDYWTTVASCINESESDDRKECFREAKQERREAGKLCKQQRKARRTLCDQVGPDRYDPEFEPENFVNPRDIGTTVAANPYFPLIEGNQWVYKSEFTDEEGEEVTELITVTVTEMTKLIDDVECRVVRDLVLVDEGDGPEPLEDTNDWYAQDVEGNVWYCGEEVKDFETFDGDEPRLPELVSIDGSFKVDRDYARPGIIMLAVPEVGKVYRQEAAPGDAEDFAEVIDISASEAVPAASCNGDCLVTREGNLLEPGAFADKYYAPGIGGILEVEGDTRVELIEFTTP